MLGGLRDGPKDWLIAIGATSLALFACNQILGVEDVILAPPRTRPDVTPDSGGTTGDDDVGPPINNLDGAPPGGKDLGALALGANHGCARLPSGTVKCWGDNGAGQLGDGIPFEQADRPQQALTPQAVPNVSNVIDLASGISHTCALIKGGTVQCWGYNFFGQLGDGTTARSSKPVQVVGLSDAISVTAGESFTCAVHQNKSASCWGSNSAGQVGDGTKVDPRLAVTPVTVLAGVASLTGARNHACAALENGDVMCWGGNDQGQLGIGSTAESLSPTKLLALSNIVQVAAAATFTCAREGTGKVYCWGSNEFGQLGNGNPNLDPNPSPILVPSIGDATFLWTGIEHACVVRTNGTVLCWGHDDNGQIGTGGAPDASVPSPAVVVGLPPSAFRVWTGGYRSCAIISDGRGFCWGSNATGELGNGTTDPALQAVPMTNFP